MAFGIVDKDGKDIEVVLQPGDAIIYDALCGTLETTISRK